MYAGIEPQSWKELRDAAGFIHDVVVAAEAQRHGVASALVEAACEWLRSIGAPRVVLWTAEKNDGAQRLFTRLGFRRTMIEMTRELERRSIRDGPGESLPLTDDTRDGTLLAGSVTRAAFRSGPSSSPAGLQSSRQSKARSAESPFAAGQAFAKGRHDRPGRRRHSGPLRRV